MKLTRPTVFAFILLIISTALYRIIPYEMRAGWLGAPQFAMAVFAGSIIKEKVWAFALPIFSMLLSDIVMQVLHTYNPAMMPGFYQGQLLNYVLIASLTVIGFFVSKRKAGEIGAGLLAAPTVFFLLSNFVVWAGNGGWHHPKTFGGLFQVYADGLPFYKMDILGSLIWGVALFGLYNLLTAPKQELQTVNAR